MNKIAKEQTTPTQPAIQKEPLGVLAVESIRCTLRGGASLQNWDKKFERNGSLATEILGANFKQQLHTREPIHVPDLEARACLCKARLDSSEGGSSESPRPAC